MTLTIKNAKADELLFVPLGGTKEIGLNLNLYRYKKKWLMVDLGAGFADDYLPGVDIIVPNIDFIIAHKKDLVGLVLTHAHEDHLGAIQYLWQELECPIYATHFTATFLKSKIAEYSFAKQVKIISLDVESNLTIGPFELEMIPLTHSAPEMHAVLIKTEYGNIFHTGDWKFDHNPIIGLPNNEERLKQIGDAGVLAVMCDSTNVFNDTPSGSEGELQKSLIEIISKCEKMVVVSTFASNLARIETIIQAAKHSNRKLVLAGRSFHRILAAARESGYLQDADEIISEKEIGKYKREQLLILATGCQGEPLAALTKVANKTHPNIKLAKDDTIIFSSKIIPGNEKKIFRMLNLLVEHGVEVLTEKDHFVHVSGHPSRDELEKLYNLLRPKIAIPVHGEQVHIHEHVKLAKQWKIPIAIQLENGDVLKLSANNAEKIATITSGYVAIDGKSLLPAESNIFKLRRKMRDEGVIFINIMINNLGGVKSIPTIKAPGLLDSEVDKELIWDIAENVKDNIERTYYSSRNAKKRDFEEQLENLVRSTVRRIIKTQLGKNPVIEIHFDFI